MAQPQKRRGYRTLVHLNQRYMWRFHVGANQSVLTIVAQGMRKERLTVIFPEHSDPWLHVGTHREADGCTGTGWTAMPRMTPGIVAEILRAATEKSLPGRQKEFWAEWRDGIIRLNSALR